MISTILEFNISLLCSLLAYMYLNNYKYYAALQPNLATKPRNYLLN